MDSKKKGTSEKTSKTNSKVTKQPKDVFAFPKLPPEDFNSDPSSSGSSDEGDSGWNTPSAIGMVERLVRSHLLWYLPGIQNAGASQLLQGKEVGNFVVHQSSHPDTRAISVRLPVGKGPYIEIYQIQANNGQLSLEGSSICFENIPSLIGHYLQCKELPVQLALPRVVAEAKNARQLSSLSLLGQEFWRYPVRPSEDSSDSLNSQHEVGNADSHQDPLSSGSSLVATTPTNAQAVGTKRRIRKGRKSDTPQKRRPSSGSKQLSFSNQ